jgi:hypothetical protein
MSLIEAELAKLGREADQLGVPARDLAFKHLWRGCWKRLVRMTVFVIWSARTRSPQTGASDSRSFFRQSSFRLPRTLYRPHRGTPVLLPYHPCVTLDLSSGRAVTDVTEDFTRGFPLARLLPFQSPTT